MEKKCLITDKFNRPDINSIQGCSVCNAGLQGIYVAPDPVDVYATIFHECFHTTMGIMEHLRTTAVKTEEVAALIHGNLCRAVMDVYDTKVA